MTPYEKLEKVTELLS